MKAFEFRGALRIFSYACEVFTEEPRRLCDPDFTTGILDTMARRGDRAALSKIESLDKLVNKLLTDHIELANRQFKDVYKETIGQGSYFIGMLTDLTLGLSDKDLLKLSRKNVQQPTLDLLKANPSEAISASMGHLLPELSEQDLSPLRKVLKSWGPAPAQSAPAKAYIIPLHSPSGGTASGQAIARYTADGWSIQLTAYRLADLGPGQFYECWYAGPGNSPGHPDLITAGTFTVGRNGSATVQMWSAADPGTFPAMQITAERAGDGGRHGQVILTGTAQSH